ADLDLALFDAAIFGDDLDDAITGRLGTTRADASPDGCRRLACRSSGLGATLGLRRRRPHTALRTRRNGRHRRCGRPRHRRPRFTIYAGFGAAPALSATLPFGLLTHGAAPFPEGLAFFRAHALEHGTALFGAQIGHRTIAAVASTHTGIRARTAVGPAFKGAFKGALARRPALAGRRRGTARRRRRGCRGRRTLGGPLLTP